MPITPSAPGLVLSRPPSWVRSWIGRRIGAVDHRAVDEGGDGVDLLSGLPVPVAGSEMERSSGMTWVPVPLGSKEGSPVGTGMLNAWVVLPVKSMS